MRKAYAVFRHLSEENRKHMSEAAAECGFGMEFFDTEEEAMGRMSDGEVIYCDKGELITGMPALKWCHSASAGVGHFLKTGVFDSGRVLLTNSSGSYGLVISEYVIMAALMLMRRMPEYEKISENCEWIQHLRIRSIAGSSFAIIGTGDIGRNSAKRFKALGASRVIGFNRSGQMPEGAEACFDEVFSIGRYEEVMGREEFDVLLLCAPGTAESEGLLSRERIALLADKTFVINVGRGIVIDQDALIEALNGERIAGAALDVVYPEPLPEDHPLRSAKNCILTPHISGDMGLPYTVDLTVDIFCENLRRFASGKELAHLVDVSAGY